MEYYQNNEYSSDASSDDYEDEDYLVDCPHCPNPVKRSNYDAHIEKVHTCDECGHQMPKKAIQGHKKRNHMEICQTCKVEMLATPMKEHVKIHYKQCKYCDLSVHQQTLEKHIQDNHPFHSTVGMICLEKLTDNEFNKLVAANRIYSKDGHLFKRL